MSPCRAWLLLQWAGQVAVGGAQNESMQGRASAVVGRAQDESMQGGASAVVGRAGLLL